MPEIGPSKHGNNHGSNHHGGTVLQQAIAGNNRCQRIHGHIGNGEGGVFPDALADSFFLILRINRRDLVSDCSKLIFPHRQLQMLLRLSLCGAICPSLRSKGVTVSPCIMTEKATTAKVTVISVSRCGRDVGRPKTSARASAPAIRPRTEYADALRKRASANAQKSATAVDGQERGPGSRAR